jgi:hypothetical protein
MDRYLGGCWMVLGLAGVVWGQGLAVSSVMVPVDVSRPQVAGLGAGYPLRLVAPGQNGVAGGPAYTAVPAQGEALRQTHPFVVPPGGSSVPLTTAPYRYEAPRSTWIPREYDGLRFYLIPLKEEPKVSMMGPGQTR